MKRSGVFDFGRTLNGGATWISIYLFLPWSNIFLGHLLAWTLEFGMINALFPINWDWSPVKRAADKIHNDKDIWSMWVWYIPSSAFYLVFFFYIVSLNVFWIFSPKRTFCSFSKQWAPSLTSDFALCLPLKVTSAIKQFFCDKVAFDLMCN